MFTISFPDNSGVKRKPYTSDISREKFAQIEPLLRSVRRSTKPIKLDLYEVFCAVLYLLRTGCQWRYLPPQLPKWHNVYLNISSTADSVGTWPPVAQRDLAGLSTTS